MSEFTAIQIGLAEIPIGQIERWESAIFRARVLLSRFAETAHSDKDREAARQVRIQLNGLAEVLERARTEHEREREAITR